MKSTRIHEESEFAFALAKSVSVKGGKQIGKFKTLRMLGVIWGAAVTLGL